MRFTAALGFGFLLCTVATTTAQAQMLTGYAQPQTAPVQIVKPAQVRKPLLTAPEVQVFSLDDVPTPSVAAASEAPALVAVNEVDVAPVEPPRVLAPQPLLTPPGEVMKKPETVAAAGNEAPVDFEADNLQHDEATRTITATGNVQLVQNGKILRAQKIVYDMVNDKAVAEGNVVLSDTNGDIHFADRLELTDQMRRGVVDKLQTYLAQGGRFTAKGGEKLADGSLKLKDAAFTPCECDNDEDDDPAWQIRAEEVDYNKQDGRIKYKNAKFEIYGVPVMYTPYLAHSDGREKQKSGLLTPGFGFNSQLGYHLTNQYYWAIGPDRDATAGVMLTTKKNPVGLLEYRQRFENASFQIKGSATSSDRKDQVNGKEVTRGEEFRGHIQSEGLWDINNKWRTGLNLEMATDDQYMRQYDFSSKDVLENELYVERFSGRNYAVGRVLAFQDVRVDDLRRDQPDVLPEMVASFTGEPNQTFGGRWHVEASALGLRRGGDGQDMNRGVLTASWQRKLISQTGLVSTVDLSTRGDVYNVNDRDLASSSTYLDNSDTETRFFPQAHIVTSYPLAKPTEKGQVLIEPLAALTLAPNINAEDDAIPNEDSGDAQLDALNLFNPNRFPGKDRIEDQSRVTYGVRSGFYGYEGSYLDAFLGQSYRFNDDDNPFPRGSGLNGQESDFVGQISGVYGKDYNLNYRFQLSAEDFSSQRHEFDGFARWERVALTSRYLYATSLEDTTIEESREQIEGIASLDLTKRWRFNSGALYDLGEDPGLRKAAVGLDYVGCCVSFAILAERNYTTDSSGDNGTDIKFRIGLDHLGLIETGSSNYWNNRSMTAD